MVDKSASCKTKIENKEISLHEVESSLKKIAKKLTKLEQDSSINLNGICDSNSNKNNDVKSKPEINIKIEEYNGLAEGYNEYCRKFESEMLELLCKREEHNIQKSNLNVKKDVIREIKNRLKNEISLIEEKELILIKDKEMLKKLNKKQIEFEGCTIIVRQNSITKEKEDAIVNPTNEYLMHEGGIAKCIVDKAGEVKNDFRNRVKRLYFSSSNTIKTGNTMVTNSGKLPCKKVIHAVGPKYNKGGLDNSYAISQMKNVTENILKAMIKDNLNSI